MLIYILTSSILINHNSLKEEPRIRSYHGTTTTTITKYKKNSEAIFSRHSFLTKNSERDMRPEVRWKCETEEAGEGGERKWLNSK